MQTVSGSSYQARHLPDDVWVAEVFRDRIPSYIFLSKHLIAHSQASWLKRSYTDRFMYRRSATRSLRDPVEGKHLPDSVRW